MLESREIFWYLEEAFHLASIFYMIRQGFRDETFGMPLVGIVLNTTWGFWFSFYVSKIYLIQPIYFFVMCILLGQLIAYGPNEFFGGRKLPFYGFLVVWIIPSLGLIRTIIDEEGRRWSHNQLFYAIMLITDVLFVHMLLSRGDRRGQHPMAAIFKSLATVSAWLYSRRPVSTYLLMGSFLADLVYIGLLYLCIEEPQAFRQWRVLLFANNRSTGEEEEQSYGAPFLGGKTVDGMIYQPAPMAAIPHPHSYVGEEKENSFEMLGSATP